MNKTGGGYALTIPNGDVLIDDNLVLGTPLSAGEVPSHDSLTGAGTVDTEAEVESVLFNSNNSATGDLYFEIEADSDNSGETDNPWLIMRQDGGAVSLELGITGGVNVKPSGGTFTGGTNNTAALIAPWGWLQLGTGTNARMTFNSSGDVGIGDSSPSFTLDVNGDGRFVQDLAVDGDLAVSGANVVVGKASGGTGCIQVRDHDDGGWTKITTEDGKIESAVGTCP